MISNAEMFLTPLVAKKGYQGCASFDELRLTEYFQSKKKKFIDLPCSSNELQQNIKRAYMQVRTWLESPFWNATDFVDPVDYGYEEPFYEPTYFEGSCKPQDIIGPCSCKKCARTALLALVERIT